MIKKKTRRARRRLTGKFYVFLLVFVAIVAGSVYGVKFGLDAKSINENKNTFTNLLMLDEFAKARTFYDNAQSTLKGRVLDQTMNHLQNALDDKVNLFSQDALQGEISDTNPAIAGFAMFARESVTALQRELGRVTDQYLDGKLEYERVTLYYNNIRKLGFTESVVASYEQKSTSHYSAMQGFRDAEALVGSGQYLEAAQIYASIPENDENFEKAQTLLNKYKGDAVENALYIAKGSADKQKYTKALEVISEALAVFPNDDRLLTKQREYESADTALSLELVEYTGPVEHVFTHCLIAFPEIANSSPAMKQALYVDCITPYEFKKIIEQLYANDYVLIDINTIWERGDDGKLKKAKLMLPRGKKPLVLSIDDVTYDARKMGMGMVDKLIVNDEGKVVTYTKMADGTELISDDNEVFPILDKFVEEHPDFSHNGAKGTLCLTGFQGLLGYRVQHDAPAGTDTEAERAGALKVAEALKANGWNFGSHSYGHGQMKSNMSLDKVKDDTNKWLSQIGSVVGETKVFFYPYGDSLHPASNAEKLDVLYNAGFELFCGVGGKDTYFVIENDGKSLFMDRRPFDGQSITNRQESYIHLIDCNSVLDPLRPLEITRN